MSAIERRYAQALMDALKTDAEKVQVNLELKDVADLFEMVAHVEKTHQRTLEHIAKSLDCNCLYKSKMGEHAFKCDECGTIVKDKCAPKICPLCNMGQGYFRIDFSIS